MESRTLMAVSLDSAGWTKITPSSDTRTIHVSSSEGSDQNNGLSADAPVKSIAKGVSLLRNGSPDWLVLKRGDTFNDAFPTWVRSGRNAQEPIVITSYGSDTERPLIRTGAKGGFFSNQAVRDVAMVGLEFTASSRDPDSPSFSGTAGNYGFQLVGPSQNVLVEDCSFDHYVYNVSIQGFNGDAKNIKVRRSQITDSYDVGIKSSGLYASQVDGLLLEGNLFDHNGWEEKVTGSVPNVFSHNIYLWASTKNAVIRDNIISNASSHGIQARGGGTIENNLFVGNPVAALIGNGSTVTPGGVSGKISGNVFLEARDINGGARGWAIEAGNLKNGGNSVISDNIIAHDTQNRNAAIKLETAGGATNASQGVGINDLTIERNIIYKWYQGLSIASAYDFGGSGSAGINDLVVRDNEFQRTSSQKIVNQPQAFDASEETFNDNLYYNTSASSGWFSVGQKVTSFDTWKNTIEPTAQNQQAQYPDPDRTMATYNASLGGANSRAAFNAAVRLQHKADWDGRFTARSVIAYVRAGFTGATPGEKPTPAPAPAPAPTTPPSPTTPTVPTTPTTPANNAAPTATLVSAADRTSAGTSQHTIKVTYLDDKAVQTNSIGNADITVTGPNSYKAAATLVSTDATTNGTPRTATYVVAAPGGAWDASDNGTYTISLNVNGVRDTDGVYAAARTLGTFKASVGDAASSIAVASVAAADAPAPAAAVAPEPAPDRSSGYDEAPPVVLWSNFDPTTQALTMKFSKDVSAGLNASDLRLKNEQTMQLVTNDQLKLSYDKATNTATWTFASPIEAADYKVMLSGPVVYDADGQKLDGNADGDAGDDYVVRITAAEMTAAATLVTMDAVA